MCTPEKAEQGEEYCKRGSLTKGEANQPKMKDLLRGSLVRTSQLLQYMKVDFHSITVNIIAE